MELIKCVFFKTNS